MSIVATLKSSAPVSIPLSLSLSLTHTHTQDHESVMVKAATGDGSSEQLPIVFTAPKFFPYELQTVCSDYTGKERSQPG